MQVAVYVRHSPETGMVQAYCPDLPGCAACGATESDAIQTLRQRLVTQLQGSARRLPPGVRVAVIDV